MIWETLPQPWQASITEAWLAYCAGSLPIGAVITDAEGRILARGRNRIFESSAEGYHLYGSVIAHAEMNAILSLDERAGDSSTYTLYTTTAPCPMCLCAIRMSQIRRIAYAVRDPVALNTGILSANAFMESAQITMRGPLRADLEAVLLAMHVAFSLRRVHPQGIQYLKVREQMCPTGVQLGRSLFASGLLQTMCDQHTPAAELINTLASILG